ncbi:hypothetical protein FRC08_006515 [Ceratobasidium sp. 394]|nr:hypothetical protein FRC08_006515 [Ceratobasidium sp. 394]
MAKRKVLCLCKCGKKVTTETQKSHLIIRHIINRRPSEANLRNAAKRRSNLNNRLSRRASQDSVNSHRNRHPSPDPPPSPIPDQFPDDNHSEIAGEDGQQMEVPNTNVDLAAIWARVLRARPPVEVEDRPESTLDGTNNAGSFQSEPGSQKSGESEDLPDREIRLEAVTDGLPRGARERFKVNNVKNGEHAIHH